MLHTIHCACSFRMKELRVKAASQHEEEMEEVSGRCASSKLKLETLKAELVEKQVKPRTAASLRFLFSLYFESRSAHRMFGFLMYLFLVLRLDLFGKIHLTRLLSRIFLLAGSDHLNRVFVSLCKLCLDPSRVVGTSLGHCRLT